jgi:hypothetical protein
MTYRYFSGTETVYEQVRANLNEAWGLPNDKGTATCFLPSADCWRDDNGNCLLCVLSEWCEYPEVQAVLPTLLASGAVQEIGETKYWAADPLPSL